MPKTPYDTPTSGIIDVQNHADTREIAINQVGIKDLRYPVHIEQRDGKTQHTIAHYQMTVGLPHHVKGTHMSRFIEILEQENKAINAETLMQQLDTMLAHLQAESGQIVLQFPYFVRKKAPISQAKSLMDYTVTLTAHREQKEHRLEFTVIIPVTSLCPCSKAISKYGAHNQRSHVTITVHATPELWFEDIIDTVEKQASCEVFGLLKRADEKFVTEVAYENPKFVEDLVRDLASIFRQDKRILYFRIESENYESIHNHSAYAMIEQEK